MRNLLIKTSQKKEFRQQMCFPAKVELDPTKYKKYSAKKHGKSLKISIFAKYSCLRNDKRDMEKDIPKIDLPQDWVIGKLTAGDIGLLNLYANYPCRLKAGIFVLCLDGEVEASINLTQFKVEPGSFITILPGSIFQIHKVDGDLQIYFMGFSSDFLSKANASKSVIDMHYIVKENPIYQPKEKALPLLKDYFELLIKTYDICGSQLNRNVINHLFGGILMGVSSMYKDQMTDKANLSKAEQISKNFTQLVMQNYTMQRSVMVCQAAWHHTSASKQHYQTNYRKNLHRDHNLHGNHGR